MDCSRDLAAKSYGMMQELPDAVTRLLLAMCLLCTTTKLTKPIFSFQTNSKDGFSFPNGKTTGQFKVVVVGF
jgi:hypothetical protein